MNPAVMSAVKRKQRGPVLFKYTAGTDPRAQGVVFTGDANRTYIDAAGVLHTVPANRPRYAAYVTDRFGVVRLVWLIEGTRTNSLINGAPMGGSWGGGATKVLNAAVAPDGTNTAFRVSNLTGAAGERTNAIALAGTNISGRTFVGGLWVKGEGADIGKHVVLQIARNAGATGAFGAGVNVLLPAMWQRIFLPGFTGAADSVGIKLVLINDGLANSASSALLWNGTVEEGSFLTSDIITGAAAVTRTAEVAHIPWVYGPQVMTVYNSTVDIGTFLTNQGRVWEIGAEGNNNFCLHNVGGVSAGAVHSVPGFAQSVSFRSDGAFSSGDTYELRTVLRKDGSARLGITQNGTAEDVRQAGSAAVFLPAWSFPHLYINSSNNGTSNGFEGFEKFTIVTGERDLSYLRSL